MTTTIARLTRACALPPCYVTGGACIYSPAANSLTWTTSPDPTHAPRMAGRLRPRIQWRFQFNPKIADCDPTWFQSRIVASKARNQVYVAARRSGKTVGVRCKLLVSAMEIRHGNIGYSAATLKQAKRLMWIPLLRDLKDPAARAAIESVNRTDMTIQFKNGTFLHIFGAEQPEGIRGTGYDLFACDESDDPNYDDAFFNEIVGPALSDQKGTLVQIGSPKGRGRLYREYRKGWDGAPDEERMPGYESIQVTAIEAGILDPEEIELARRIRPARAFRQEYEATFEAPIGMIYDEWDEKVHLFTDRSGTFDETIACVDWGTGSRGSMLILGRKRVWVSQDLDENDEPVMWDENHVYVLDEVSESGMGYDDGGWWAAARKLQERWCPRIWYADPAGGREGYLRQLSNALTGYHAKVKPADNQVLPGIAAVREFLHCNMDRDYKPALYVHESCKWTRAEMADYKWRPHSTREDEFTDDPLKVNDHCLDALRYGIFTHFYRPHGAVKRRASLELERGR